MKFPRIPRELNRKIKLQFSDIDRILEMHKQGFSQMAIAKKFNVSKFAIQYWLKTPEQRKLLGKINRSKYEVKKVAKAKSMKSTAEYRKKILLQPTREYWRELSLNNLSKRQLLDSYIWHKNRLDKLLKREPLLVLFK